MAASSLKIKSLFYLDLFIVWVHEAEGGDVGSCVFKLLEVHQMQVLVGVSYQHHYIITPDAGPSQCQLSASLILLFTPLH